MLIFTTDNTIIYKINKTTTYGLGVYHLSETELTDSLNIKDLTDPINGTHSINLIIDEIQKNLKNYSSYDINTIRNSPIVDSKDNYDNLYYPTDTVTRSSRYTHWISDTKLLRTHTTSGIPNLLKSLTKEGIYLLPGIVYRRDVIDRTHVGEPHQLDIWKLTKNTSNKRTELLELVNIVVNSILPGIEWRYNETSHYYTLNGIEVEVLINGNWLEILECGEAHPQLLKDAGLSDEWSGLAMGIGLDRAVMIKKGITDIRILRSVDERISSQMLNLDTYKEVSNYPTIKIDLSVSINKDIDSEILGDKVRRILGDESNVIEEVVIKSETSYEDLPPHVSERLGMNSSMKNILIGITLRALDRTLTKDESNRISREIYVSLHEGTKGYLK